MKRRRALLLSIAVVLALCISCGVWLHRERQQYALNRQLIAALVRNDTKTALALVNAGADPNTRYDPPPTPSLKLLLNQLLHHIPPPANETPTAFMLACGTFWLPISGNPTDPTDPGRVDENLSLLQKMLAHGANVHTKRYRGSTVLLDALDMGPYSLGGERRRTVELLLQHGVDVDAPDKWSQTPLMRASGSKGNAAIVHFLLAHGANPNAQDENGMTALFYTSESPEAKIVILDLMAHGADLTVCDTYGRTPIQLFQRWERPDLVRLLKQHGAK